MQLGDPPFFLFLVKTGFSGITSRYSEQETRQNAPFCSVSSIGVNGIISSVRGKELMAVDRLFELFEVFFGRRDRENNGNGINENGTF